jgi:hypothetical protein
MVSNQRRLLGVSAVHRSAPERTSSRIYRGELPVADSPSLLASARVLFSLIAVPSIDLPKL